MIEIHQAFRAATDQSRIDLHDLFFKVKVTKGVKRTTKCKKDKAIRRCKKEKRESGKKDKGTRNARKRERKRVCV